MSSWAMDFLLEPETTLYLTGIVKKTAEAAYQGRNLITPLPMSYGKDHWEYKTEADTQEPMIGRKGMKIPLGMMEYTKTIGPIYKQAQGFILTEEEVAVDGTVDTEIARNIAHKMAKQEDELIQVGWYDSDSTAIVTGLYNGATPTQAASNTWGSASATPYEDVNAGIAQMEAVGIMSPYLMALTSTNRSEAFRRDTMGNMAWTHINERGVTDMLLSDKLTANTGMIVKKQIDYAFYAMPEDIRVTGPFPIPENQAVRWNVTMQGTPVVVEPYSICTLTSL